MNDINALKKRIQELEAKIKKLETSASRTPLDDIGRNIAGIDDIVTSMQDRTKVVEEALVNLSKIGATFAYGGTLNQSLQDSSLEMDKYLASAKDAGQAFDGLTKNIQQFGLIAESSKDNGNDLASSLGTQAALLRRLGVDYGDFSKNVESAIYSFGQSAEGVKSEKSYCFSYTMVLYFIEISD